MKCEHRFKWDSLSLGRLSCAMCGEIIWVPQSSVLKRMEDRISEDEWFSRAWVAAGKVPKP